MGINWKQKLASRKFVLAVIALAAAILVFLGKSESEIAQVSAIIAAGADIVAYILGEAKIDAARITKETADPAPEQAPAELVTLEAEPVYNTEGEGL